MSVIGGGGRGAFLDPSGGLRWEHRIVSGHRKPPLQTLQDLYTLDLKQGLGFR